MPAKPVQVGKLHFERKGDATEFFKKILYSYDLGDRVSIKDATVLTDLISKHPKASEKIGTGIQSFSVRSANFNTRCFWVNRTDDTTIKFSFKACY